MKTPSIENKATTLSSVLALFLTAFATLAVMPMHPLFIAIPILVALGTMKMLKDGDYGMLQASMIPVVGFAYSIVAGMCGMEMVAMFPIRKTHILAIDNMSAFFQTGMLAIVIVAISAVFAGKIMFDKEQAKALANN
jgi:hypothetical protein